MKTTTHGGTPLVIPKLKIIPQILTVLSSIHFDTGQIRKSEITPEGFLRAEAVFARDGVLEYHTPTGVRRELRTPEANKKAITTYGLKPVSIEHPPILLDSSNAKQYTVGLSDSTVVYDKGGFVKGVITVFDSEGVQSIRSGETPEISIGYKCKLNFTPGTWNGQHYDAIQEEIEVNHICATRKGRAGPDVRIHLDSADPSVDIAYQVRADSQSYQSMATILVNGVTYDNIPEVFAGVISRELKDLERLRSRVDSLESSANSLKEVSVERDRQMGRADGLEQILYNADALLADYKIYRGDDGQYYTDNKPGKKPAFLEEEDEEEMEEDEMDEEAEDEEEPPPKKKKAKKDSIAEVLAAWKDADKLVPGLSDSKFDSELDVCGIRKLVVAELRPDFRLDSRSPDAIDAAYDILKEQQQSSRDSQSSSRTDDLQSLISMTRAGGKNPLETAQQQRSAEVANNWQSPLSLSR